MKFQITCRLAVYATLSLQLSATAVTILSDDFSTSSLNSHSPAAPGDASTAYHLFSSKTWFPTPFIGQNNLQFGINTTTGGHIEAQALFASTPVTLANEGDYVELTVTFYNASGLFTQAGHVGFGLYNSGGTAPIPGGMNGSALNTTAGITGGAQGWRGYVSRIAYSGGSHAIATRPAQSSTTGNNQDLVTQGSSSQSYTGGVTLASAPSTFSQASFSPLTENLRITLTGIDTFQIQSRLYDGYSTNGPLLLSQTAAAVSGANFLTNSFDALAIGWRATANTEATLIIVQSITVNSSVVTEPGNSVAGIYFQQPPTPTIAGTMISPGVTVVATNVAGAPVTNAAITLAISSGTGPLNGTLTQTTGAGGLATFNDLNLSMSGTKRLLASTTGTTVVSNPFDILPAAAVALGFAVQPYDVQTNAPIAPATIVQALDSYGNPVSTNGVAISISLGSGTGSLTGTTNASTDNAGQAAFANLRLTAIGTKQLAASATPLAEVTSSSFSVTELPTQIRAFPGAEGAGAYALGGRGGDVYYVTTLADSGAGTLRAGISGAPAGGRTICFKVSGNIALSSTLTVNKPNLTIAGQTAPGDGVCIQNNSFNISANNVIVRHLRTRLGTNNLAEADSMWIASGTNVIVDHVSASWSVDETLSASGNTKDLTVQWCYIAESLNNSIHSKGPHGYGSLITPSVNGKLSWHHNLYAHNNSRNPRPGTDSGATVVFDFCNNTINNFGGRAGYGNDWDPDPENLRMNYIANYVIAGPSSAYNFAYEGGGTNTYIYQATNRIDLNLNNNFDGSDTGWGMFSGTFIQTNTPFAAPALTIDPAPVALQRVLALGGAMPWRRDTADQRIVATVRQHNGQIIDAVAQVGTWPTLNSTTAPTDTDSDGMPDWWEVALGLNPNLASDRNLTNTLTGYTRLEDYLNWLADAHALCPRNGQVDVSLGDATGGATNLTYSVSSGTNGTVALLGDGYTARFTAVANYNGVANFTFNATDAANATTIGPVNYAVLITSTNANNLPVLATITNRTVMAGTIVNFTCSATDTDTPPQTVTFALQDGQPGATLGTNTGIFNWRPAIAQGNTTNTMSVIATDNGAVSLAATQCFTVTVLKPVQPQLGSTTTGGGQFTLVVSGDAGPDYTILASTNLVDWAGLFTTNSPALPFGWSDPETGLFGERYFRILLGP